MTLFKLTSQIYKFYTHDQTCEESKTWFWKCNVENCKSNSSQHAVKQKRPQTSNLISHLDIDDAGHRKAKAEFLALTETNKIGTPTKRMRFDQGSPRSPQSPIYNSFKPIAARDRAISLNKMIIKCMLPISIIENPDFREYHHSLDKDFELPSIKTLKKNILNLASVTKEKVKVLLKDVSLLH